VPARRAPWWRPRARGSHRCSPPIPAGVIFTGGATEAVNLAIKGSLLAAPAAAAASSPSPTEHSCVLESAAWLGRVGFSVTILPVLPTGLPDMDAYRAALGPDVALVAAMRVNNEVGTIMPVADIAAAAHEAGALVLSDAAQGFGKVDCAVETLGADMIAVSAHKLHGPKASARYGHGPASRSKPCCTAAARNAHGRARFRRCSAPASARPAPPPNRRATRRTPRLSGRGNGGACRHPAPHQRQHRSPLARQPFAHAARRRCHRARVPRRGVALSTGSACGATDAKPSHVLRALGLSSADLRSTCASAGTASPPPTMCATGIARVLAAAGQRAAA
jgi:cysteine desulfurase